MGNDTITYKLTTTNPPNNGFTQPTDYSHRLRQHTGRSNPNKHLHLGSKSEQGVGAGIAIIIPGTTPLKMMYRKDTTRNNKQAEAFVILKALEYIKTNQANEED